jgi:hypothetical protein
MRDSRNLYPAAGRPGGDRGSHLDASNNRMSNWIKVSLVLGLHLVCWPTTSSAVLNIFSDFDHASLASWSGTLSNISLTGRSNYPGSPGWRWLYFEATGRQGAQPVFSINQDFAGGNSALNAHKMVYSYDNENWFFFDNNWTFAQR